MNHPLDGARLKIVRAQEHLNALKAQIGRYIEGKPYALVVEKDGAMWTGRCVVRMEPPPRFSSIVGDCVTNARAALDYIAWQLASKYFRPVLNPEVDRWVYFPISVDTSNRGYVKKINEFADRQIPAAAIAEIHAVQPGNALYRSLAWLQTIVNTDKHRMPILTYNVTEIKSLVVFSSWSRTEACQEGGDDTMGISLPTSLTTEDMQVDGQVTGFITLKDIPMPVIAPVDLALEEIVKTVADIIPRFDSFF